MPGSDQMDLKIMDGRRFENSNDDDDDGDGDTPFFERARAVGTHYDGDPTSAFGSFASHYEEIQELLGGPTMPYGWYLQQYADRHRLRRPLSGASARRWLRDNVWNSVFFMGWLWLVPIYLLQVLFVVLLATGVLSTAIIPDDFIFNVVSTLFFFLVSFITVQVASNGKQALSAIAGGIQGTAREMSALVTSIVDERAGDRQRTYPMQRFDRVTGRVARVDHLDKRGVLRELRLLINTYIYGMSRLGRYENEAAADGRWPCAAASDDRLFHDARQTLDEVLDDELHATVLVPTRELFFAKLVSMIGQRLDALYSQRGVLMGTQVVTHTQARVFSSSTSQAFFTASDLNLPVALLNALLVAATVLLISYSFQMFPAWGTAGTLIFIWVPNLLFNGIVWFGRYYNDPFRMAARGLVTGVDLERDGHLAARDVDQIMAHAIRSLSNGRSGDGKSEAAATTTTTTTIAASLM